MGGPRGGWRRRAGRREKVRAARGGRARDAHVWARALAAPGRAAGGTTRRGALCRGCNPLESVAAALVRGLRHGQSAIRVDAWRVTFAGRHSALGARQAMVAKQRKSPGTLHLEGLKAFEEGLKAEGLQHIKVRVFDADAVTASRRRRLVGF